MIRRALLVLTLLAATGSAQRLPGDSASRWVDSIFAPVASRQGPGCAVGVVQNGALTFAKGYGMADLEHDTPITPRRGSTSRRVSKQFTAMSIVLLAQDHRLSLDDSIRKWVPEVPSFGASDHAAPTAAPHERPARLLHAARRVGLAERRTAHRAAVARRSSADRRVSTFSRATSFCTATRAMRCSRSS